MEIPSEHRHQIIEEQTPTWALDHDPGTASGNSHAPAHGASPMVLLYDEQHHIETDTHFFRAVYHLPTFASVQEGSRFQVAFAPESERLAIHTLRIRRDGQEIDHLGIQSVLVLNRETQMERFVFDGHLQAVFLLNDVRAGDTIDYSYSRQAIKASPFGRITGRFILQGNYTAKSVRRRLIYHPDRRIYVLPCGCNLQPEVTLTDDGLMACEWRLKNVKPPHLEPNVPNWALPFSRIDYGEFQTWEEVAEAASPLFAPSSDPLPAHIADWVKQWTASGAPPEEFILQAIRFVQENIRYVAIGIDEHRVRPYPISTILERNYGDCKDKSTLLCHLLREAGHDATPVLVNSQQREHAVSGLPQPTAFDHAIVRLRRGGRTHWIDPTMTDQGGTLDTLHHPSYGYALVLNSPGQGLEKIPLSSTPSAIRYDEFIKVHRTDGSAELKVTRIYTGKAANGMRHELSTKGLTELDRQLLSHYQNAYLEPHQQAPSAIEDHRAENRLTVTTQFHLHRIWQNSKARGPINQAYFPVLGIRSALRLPEMNNRQMPSIISHPVTIFANLEVRLPAGFKMARQQANFSSAGFHAKFFRETSSNSGRVSIEYQSLRNYVSAQELTKHAEAIQQLANAASFLVRGHENVIARGFNTPASGMDRRRP